MSARPVSVSAADLDTAPFEKTITLRGVTYRFRELSIGEYDDLVKKATTTKQNALGEDIDTLDQALLLRLMVLNSCISPKLRADRLNELSMPVVLKINKLVNDMHYGDVPEDKPKDDDEAVEEDAEKAGPQ